jgi:secreted trypsin-like serine protease
MRRARLTMLVALAALVVATLALAGVAWAQQQGTGEGDVGTQVVGGTKVPDGKYPFMASLEADTSARPPSKEQFCGGTLIDPDSVLTAAHCVDWIGNTTDLDRDTLSFRDLRVVVGVTALDSGQGQARRVARLSDISIHPRYDERNPFLGFDAAVIELDRPVEGIQPIKLAPIGSDSLERPGTRAKVAGWGSLLAVPPGEDNPEVKFPNRMREARIPIVSDEQCKRAYLGGVFKYKMVCAGQKDRGTCFGDSGGPLFATVDGRPREIGILSFTAGCAAKGFPAVFTEVSAPPIGNFIRSAASG